MATLLNCVNEVLKRVQVIQGDSGLLTSLTDPGRQVFIDLAVQVWNELIEDLYSQSNIPMPNELAENTITLVTSDRDYALQTDLVQLHFPLIDETNGQYITEYPGGYMQMVEDQNFPSNYTGLANYAAIRPTDGELYLDRIPTANENGLVYKYRYDKDVSMSLAADTVPFTDAVFRALVPAAAEMWKIEQHNKFSQEIYEKAFGKASTLLTQVEIRDSWLPLTTSHQNTDPMN